MVLRMLAKRPGFTLIAVLTLALGIGATAAVFSLIQGVLLTPPPYDDPQRLVLVEPALTVEEQGGPTPDWAAAQWLRWQEEAKSFEGIAAHVWSFSFLVSEDGSESLEGMRVTREYFDVVGLEPLIGRTFEAADTEPGADPVMILGHDLWLRRFGGDPAVLGQTLRISRQETPPTVIGVMPPGVRFLPSARASREPNYDVDALVDFWAPAAPTPEVLMRRFWSVVARLEQGVTPESARAELELIDARHVREEPDLAGTVPRLRSVVDFMNAGGRRILLPLLGAAGLVLLIACGNAAALLLVRGLQRQHEYGVRRALGARRFALILQVVSESLALALLGGALGVVLAIGIVRMFKAIGSHAVPRLDTVTLGWPVLLYGLGAAVAAALLAAIYPALRTARLSQFSMLSGASSKSSAGRAERRLLSAVTMIQAALTLALLVGAGLLIRTMGNLARVDSGYDTESVLTMSVTAVEGSWADFHRQALERVAAIPGVDKAAFAWGVPLTGNNWPGEFEIEGRAADDPVALPSRSVTPGYFELLGQQIVEGRDLRSSDDSEAPPVAVVNQALADRYFPGATPLGKKLWFPGRQQEAPPGMASRFEIVGVVSNARTDDLTRASEPEIYYSLWQRGAFSKHLVVRTSGDALSVAGEVQRALHEVAPTAAVENLKTLEQIRGDSVASRSFATGLLVAFAIVASVLTLGGLYGVLSLSVALRRREIAIRTAVGAGRGNVLSMILKQGLLLIGVGIAAGSAASVLLSRGLGALLFEVEPTDPATLLVVAVAFASVALVACWFPASRATRVDPVQALREE
ncbi:MAG TPA: ABC transporter permease [Thermoanaerobaculia bacterium]|nr:ABC transporter permease [Thermoanaerobaculia bacterium]